MSKAKCTKCGEEFEPKPKRPRVCEPCVRTDAAIAAGLKSFMSQPEVVNLRAGILTGIETAFKRTFDML